jgi:hypothetical protein
MRLFDIDFPDIFSWLLDEMGELPLPRKERGTAIPNPLKLIGVRYKAQLLEHRVNSLTGEAEHKAQSAQAAQVHWLDLLNVVSSRLPADKANVNKRFTLEEEIRRASVRADWTSQFLGYTKGMRKFDDIFHHQTEMRNTIIFCIKFIMCIND